MPPNHGPAWPASRPKNRLPIHPLPGDPMRNRGCFALFLSVCLNLPLFVVGVGLVPSVLAGLAGGFNALKIRTAGPVSTSGRRRRVWVTKTFCFRLESDDAVAGGMAGRPRRGHVCWTRPAVWMAAPTGSRHGQVQMLDTKPSTIRDDGLAIFSTSRSGPELAHN